MCGIAGYFGSKKISDESICHTLSLMKNRGPDYRAYEKISLKNTEKYGVFLHTRLSIIDLDARAHQPFRYHGKILIYNGEIYNYIEVRNELIKLGHHFITHSDTEVLIHALDEWDTKTALNKIEGMWAFALFDEKKQMITLSRDPFGEKPLYLYEPSPEELYFASEIKFLSSLSGKKFTPSLDHVTRFLVNGYKSLYKKDTGYFKEITEFPKSSFQEINLFSDKKTPQKYWHPIISTDSTLSFHDAVVGAKTLLIDSVKMRLRSDIPIAFCMSGGVDSNSLISIAKRVFNYDVHGFTIVNFDRRYEEQDMVNAGVNGLKIKHSAFPVSSDHFITNLQKLTAYHDAPILTITYYLDWLLQQAISEKGYRVSVSGTAADELFSGYFDHQLMYLYDIRHDAHSFEESVQNWKRDTGSIVRNPFLQNPYAFVNDPFSRKHIYLDNEKYSSYLHKPWHEEFFETYYRNGLLQNRMMNEIFHETTPPVLHEIDLNSMYCSVESRAPFLDRRLFTFCHSIPTQHLIKNGAAKAVLREAMRGIVPDDILNSKRKVGFNAPIMDLLDLKNIAIKKYILQDSPIWDILKKDCVEKLMAESHLPNSDSKFIFSFLSSKMFLEKFS